MHTGQLYKLGPTHIRKFLTNFLCCRVNSSHWNLSAPPQSMSTSPSYPLLTAASPKTMLILSGVRLPLLGLLPLLPLLLLPNLTRNVLIMWRFLHNSPSPLLFKGSHLSNVVQQQNVSTNEKSSCLSIHHMLRPLCIVGPHLGSTSGMYWQQLYLHVVAPPYHTSYVLCVIRRWACS